MTEKLDEIEARILGSLIEKSKTTPEQYPLSFNALLSACNQKTSRDPVMTLDIDALGKGVSALVERGLVERVLGSRVPRFRARAEGLFGADDPRTFAVLCVLLLRGPQTPGEIKTRTERMCEFAGTAEVEGHLQDLAARAEDPLVARMPRRPGQKETRYRHLFSDQLSEPEAPPARPAASAELEGRVAALEERVKILEEKLAGQA